MKLAVLFDNLGLHHIARLLALGSHCDPLAVEQHASSAEHEWHPSAQVPFRRVTLFENTGVPREAASGQTLRAISEVLSGFSPDVIAVPGWAGEQAISAVTWALWRRVPVIVMSDSQEIDFPHTTFREWIKRRYLGCCDGALVGRHPQSDYRAKLGMNATRIRLLYDVVDSEYFDDGAGRARANASALRQQHSLPERYFLISARFFDKKNLPQLIQAFTDFLRVMDTQVLMPGFKQYPELPLSYSLAQTFILARHRRTMGSVVNEGMASGLSVLVSDCYGCARDRVQQGVNGYTVEPRDVSAFTGLMVRLAENEDRRRAMGEASASLIELAEMVKRSPRTPTGWVDRMMLNRRRGATR